MSLKVGAIVEGVVTGITHFGAFVELPGGKTGLVHISEVADAFVKDIKDYLTERQPVKVKVLSIDEQSNKIGLSIKQVNRRPNDRARHVSFEDRLARFMKDSDERLTDLRKNTDSKRGGRGAGRRGEMF
ncbi:MAG: S1 RNA-binding domain-containing protein [Bacillota bacterium]